MSEITRKYPWAANKQKLERAIEAVTKQAVGKIKVTEQAIKDKYLSFAGKLQDVPKAEAPSTQTDAAATENAVK